MNSINVNYKYYLKKLSAYKKFDEIILPRVDCLKLNQLNYIKRKLKEDGIIQETYHGGQWNDELFGFEASRFKVDWNQWEVVYRGYLKDVPYVDIEKEWKSKIIAAQTNARLAKECDFEISSTVNRRISGLTLNQIENVVRAKYWQIGLIEEIEKLVEPQMIVANTGKINFVVEKDVLRRISYRPSNSYTSLKKSDGSRKAFLEKHNLHSNPNGDIKSEIPRVNHLIEKGEWLSFSFDFYSAFVNQEKASDSVRAVVKANFMPMYMTHFETAQTRANRLATQYINKKQIEDEGLRRQAKRLFETISNRMEDLLGKIHHSEIFVHTSCIEHIALFLCCKLYPNGMFFQIYDEIFSTEDIDCMEEIYEIAAKLYKYLLQLQSEGFPKIKEEEELEFLAALVATTRKRQTYLERDKDKQSLFSKLNIDCLTYVVSYVRKLKDSNSSSSSSLIFGAAEPVPIQAKDARHGVAGRSWQLSEETKQRMCKPKSEETKQKMRKLKSEETRKKMCKPKSEETKQKMSKPKSEETKQKIKDATNRDTEYLDVLRKIKLEKNYIEKTKTRAKQQYIDTRLQEVFGELSKTTLTKIRKMDTSN